MLFFGDDHGGEAVVGRRDAYEPATICCFGVVGAVFADWNALALRGIINQQGVRLVT